tara:strand:+ start:46 stop:429 length:384 start_codon:yes stop_codon:yes gene_type:complete
MFRSKAEKKAAAEPKQKKTKTKEEWNAYMKQYRLNNLEKVKQIEKCKYYKKNHNLTQKHINMFGIYSAEAARIIKSYKSIIEAKPEYRDLLLIEILGETLSDSEISESDSESETTDNIMINTLTHDV